MLQIGTASLLQIGARVITNWGSYYKLGQPLLQNRWATTNWAKCITNWGINKCNKESLFQSVTGYYYKLHQVLQCVTVITKWDVTLVICYKE